MSAQKPPSGLIPSDYDDIEAAVMETARGRWFMLEFARRIRATETQKLLDLASRLEAMLAAGPPSRPEIADSGAGSRLLLGRLQDIAGRLSGLSAELRAAGVAAALSSSLEAEARALAALGGGEIAIAPPAGALAAPEPEPDPAPQPSVQRVRPARETRAVSSVGMSAIEALAQLAGQEQATLTA